jgi:hypothetical protein
MTMRKSQRVRVTMIFNGGDYVGEICVEGIHTRGFEVRVRNALDDFLTTLREAMAPQLHRTKRKPRRSKR